MVDRPSSDEPLPAGGGPSASGPESPSGAEPVPPLDAPTERLAAGAQGGDAAQFAALYERVAPALHAWAQLRIRRSMRMHVDPADLVQEVWVRAVTAFPRFDPATRSFRAWLFTIAKNVLLEGFRKLRRSPWAAGEGGPTTRLFALANVPDDVTSLSRRLGRDEAVGAFVERVGELADEDRQLLVHCGLEGLTCAEAARRLDLGEAAVVKRWQRLRARLREQGWARRMLDEA